MPHSKSAKKRLRQSIKRNLYNKSVKSALSSRKKKFRAALATGDAELAATEFRRTVSAYKKAVARGVIHRNVASRTESRLAQKLNTLETAPSQ